MYDLIESTLQLNEANIIATLHFTDEKLKFNELETSSVCPIHNYFLIFLNFPIFAHNPERWLLRKHTCATRFSVQPFKSPNLNRRQERL